MKTRSKILIILSILVLIVIVANITTKSSKEQVFYPKGVGSSRGIELRPLASKEEARTSEDLYSGRENKTSARIVIKSGELNLVVNNVENNAKQIIEYAEKNNGWVVSSEITKLNEIPIATITVRVPVERFETAMDYFSSLAVKVENEKMEGNDVTEEYTDLKSQLRNLEATEKQLLKIMQKADKVSDVLAVQREITNIRGEIEKTKGKILYIQRSAKMSTIIANLSLSEELLPVPSGERWKPQYVAKKAWKNVVVFWRNVTYLLIRIGVYALIWVPIVVIIWLIWRTKRKKQNQRGKK